MNRRDRRAAARTARLSKKPTPLSQRARFETEMREALALADIRVISVAAAVNENTKQPQWVFCVYAGGRFLHITSPQGTVADIANGVVAIVKQTVAGETQVDVEVPSAQHELVDDGAPPVLLEREPTFAEKVSAALRRLP